MKIVPKNLGEEAARSRDEASLKQRIVKEICIQKSLDHPNIVMFKHAFEDQDNVYILLELCRKETLKDMIKKTGRLNEDLAKRYILQLANALKYIHKQKIIHRDVKLTNLFLTEKMELKLGDFGLSTRLGCANDHRFTVCGTPDYVAPEVLKKCGYSYEADIWSVGVVAYHILIGKLPFDNPDQRVVMKKIMERNFSFPDDVDISNNAKHFISSILVLRPEKRPGLDQILMHPFLDSAHVALDADPSIYMFSSTCKEPLLSNNVLREKPTNGTGRQQTESPCSIRQICRSPIFEKNTRVSRNFSSSPKKYRKSQFYSPSSTKDGKHSLSAFQASSTATTKDSQTRNNYHKENQPPFYTSLSSIKKKSQPITINEIFVAKWLDYNSKYGMGYILSNGLLGVIFTDNTQIFSFPHQQDGGYFEYFDIKLKDGKDVLTIFNFKKYPQSLETKVKLYFYFQEYLENNRTGVSAISNFLINTTIEKENINLNGNSTTPVYINRWMKTEQAIFFKMSNKIFQVIFKDGAMLIINPFENTSRYINKNGEINNTATNDSGDSDVDEMLQRVSYVKGELNEAWRNLNDS